MKVELDIPDEMVNAILTVEGTTDINEAIISAIKFSLENF